MGNTTERNDDRQGHPNVREDLIDFPCSHSFAAHYYDEGYSTYRPPEPKRQTSANEKELIQKVDSLATEVAGFHGIVQALVQEVQTLRAALMRMLAKSTSQTPPNSVGIGVTEKELARVGTHD